MSIIKVRATVECDGCGKQFHSGLADLASEVPAGWSLHELAEDYVRGGNCDEGGMCSVQADMHLCAQCTATADSIGTEDYRPTRAEINAALDRAAQGKTGSDK